jgi:hypothetical protein
VITCHGITGIRDPDNICEFFAPGEPGTEWLDVPCNGDGHYLCKECKKHVRPDPTLTWM